MAQSLSSILLIIWYSLSTIFKTPLFNDTTVWTYFQFINIDNKLFDKTISYWNRRNDPIIDQAYNNLNDKNTKYETILDYGCTSPTESNTYNTIRLKE